MNVGTLGMCLKAPPATGGGEPQARMLQSSHGWVLMTSPHDRGDVNPESKYIAFIIGLKCDIIFFCAVKPVFFFLIISEQLENMQQEGHDDLHPMNHPSHFGYDLAAGMAICHSMRAGDS